MVAKVVFYPFLSIGCSHSCSPGWHTQQINFVLAYPQAPLETLCTWLSPRDLPWQTVQIHQPEYVLELVRNLYGQKQAGRVWNKFLHKGLLKAGFTQSSINECVYYRGRTIFLVYVDDGLFFALTANNIDKAIKDIKDQGYNISNEGEIDDYLGVKIEKKGNTVTLMQPHLIDQILEDTGLSACLQASANTSTCLRTPRTEPRGQAT